MNLFRFVRGQTRNESSIKDYVLSDPPPYFEPARKIRNTSKDIGIKLTLYQYQVFLSRVMKKPKNFQVSDFGCK